MGSLRDEHAAVCKRKRCRNRQAISKDGEFIRFSIAVGIRTDEYPIITAVRLAVYGVRISDRFNDPEPPPLIPVHRYGFTDIRLFCEQFQPESRWNLRELHGGKR